MQVRSIGCVLGFHAGDSGSNPWAGILNKDFLVHNMTLQERESCRCHLSSADGESFSLKASPCCIIRLPRVLHV